MSMIFTQIENSTNYTINKCVNRGKTVEILGTINTDLEISPSPDLKRPISNFYKKEILKEFRRDVLGTPKNKQITYLKKNPLFCGFFLFLFNFWIIF